MAARYWVGGAGTWSSTNTTNWSTTSGGAGGATVPGSADTPTFDANSGSGTVSFTNGGVTTGAITLNSANITLSLGAAIATSGTMTVTAGTFTTNNYNVTATGLVTSGSSTRAINLGSSTITVSAASGVNFGSTSPSGLTFNAGTSQITCTAASWTFSGNGQTFYNVSFTSTAQTSGAMLGANTFNNLTFAGNSASALASFSVAADLTINGTLTFSAGANATCRKMLRSSVMGATRTLTCGAVTATDVDFRDISIFIAGSGAPITGTRLGDCKGNSGITFGSGVTKYWNLAAGGNWSATGWATTSGGTPAANNFPLPQDTAVIQSTGLNSGATITMNAGYNIGTLDMSARTSNTMTLSLGTQAATFYGNLVFGTGVTVSGTATITFAGRVSQLLTCAGLTFTFSCTVDSPGGSLTLQDAFTSNRVTSGAITLTSGTFDANGYNVTMTAGGVSLSGSGVRTMAIGSGTWTIPYAGVAWNATVTTNLTVTGTGTLNFTSASAKTFSGGGIQTYPNICQAGAGALSILGSNKFIGITNTAIGSVLFEGLSTNEFTSTFDLNGASGNLLTLGSTNTTPVTLKKTGNWNVGANSVDAGNNTGLSFI